ncbi:MAG: polysaccharide deacetylase family protein [Proteobacteria bacterium]|nr:polysaccharide deacetylase family protein [Pseudomonadota bacterium]
MLKSLLTLASPGRASGRLSIIDLHRVVPGPDPLFLEAMDVARFEALCRWLAGLFNVLPLDEAAARLKAGTLPPRALAITFDDGYADNHDVALPILQRHGLTATFFISTGFIDGGRMWNDGIIETFRLCPADRLDLRDLLDDPAADYTLHTARERRTWLDVTIGKVKYRPIAERLALVQRIAERARVRLPDDLMMTRAQVVALRRAGMTIGAHTMSHPILATLSRDEASAEIDGSRRWLEALLDERIGLFAYPNGKPGEDYHDETVTIVKSLGFDAAVSTDWAAAHRSTDPHQLPRFTPWDRTRARFCVRMARNLWRSRAHAAARTTPARYAQPRSASNEH